MNKALNPTHIAPPYKNRYSHAIEVPADARMLYISGTVGVKPDGSVPAEFAAQVETVMQNLTEILKAGGMDWNDVVKFQGFLTPQTDLTTFAEVRQRYFGPQKPAMTVVWVVGLADPRWMVEVDLVAAKSEARRAGSRTSGGSP
jgi:enamine deaminase RidA (YjgF/YER057c/UK114 family)